MASVEKSIEVNVPLSTACNQRTQFESFPQFMEGVKEVEQLDHKTLRWRAEKDRAPETERREHDEMAHTHDHARPERSG